MNTVTTTVKTYDVTDLSENALAAFFAIKTGDDDFVFDILTADEMRALQPLVPEFNMTTWIILAERGV